MAFDYSHLSLPDRIRLFDADDDTQSTATEHVRQVAGTTEAH